MDEGLSRAVLKVFVELYRQGLIYRDKRLVNWDPKLQTAISDLEVEQVEVKGSLWHIKYPIEGADDEYIIVATTRPETMLGDTAVAVHPDDERYRHLIGKHAILPLVGRRIPIVADEYSDPEKGTGAVKITPAHDFNDFEVGRRHHLPLINVLDVEGKLDLAENAAFARRRAAVRRADRDARAARPRPLRGAQEDRRAPGGDAASLDKIEPHTHMVPHGDRCERRDRAVPHRPVVRQRQGAGRAGDRGGARRPHAVRAEELGEDLFRLDGEHPAVVHLAPALVGPSDPGLVRAGRQGVRRRDRGRGAGRRARLLRRQRRADAGRGRQDRRERGPPRDVPQARRGRARHLVLLRAVAVLDARLAGRDAGTEALLPDQRAGHRLRHHLLLGRPHDDDGPALHEGGAVPHRLHPRAGARRARRQDVEVEGQRHRSAAPDRRLRRRRAALHAGRDGGAGARHQALDPARRGLPQLRDQAVERGALCRDERRRDGAGLRSAPCDRDAEQVDRARTRQGGARDHRARSRPTSSTRRRARPIASSGTSTATGISSSPSRCSPGRTARPRARRAPWSPGCATRC